MEKLQYKIFECVKYLVIYRYIAKMKRGISVLYNSINETDMLFIRL